MKTERDKIIEILKSSRQERFDGVHAALAIFPNTFECVADRILAIQQEGAKERFEKGMRHFDESDKHISIEETVRVIQSLQIASGYEPTK